MANYIEHLGLGFLTETEEQVRTLWRYIAQEGEGIFGYYGLPYFNCYFGDAQLILRTLPNDEEKNIEIVGMDTHSSGNCVWDVRICGMNIARKGADVMERRCVVHRADDGGGMAVINIVNADVLPSFDEGERIRLQMVAFPHLIEYFADAQEYIAAQPEQADGKKWILSDGTLMPAGLMRNRNPENEEFESDDELDDLMLIRGTVKKLYHGMLKWGDDQYGGYLRCIIQTDYGDLEIVHTVDDVKEEQRDNIKLGAVVNGVFTLSGDAAVYEYENGFILDEEHNLSILRSTFAGADAERMRLVFSEDATYISESDEDMCTGRDAVIERLKEISEAADDKCYARLAVIVSSNSHHRPLAYRAGKRCIVLSRGGEKDYEAIAFADIDDKGRISKLLISTDRRYEFCIDEKIII